MAVELLIPFACNREGRPIPPTDPSADPKLDYKCPLCEGVVRLRPRKPSSRYRRHFFHVSMGPECKGEGAQENLWHMIAKIMIMQAVNDWKDGGLVPMVFGRCPQCGDYSEPRPLPTRITQARTEKRLDYEGHRADVAIFEGDKLIAAIEVHHTHRVGKTRDGLNIPWAEVESADIIEQGVKFGTAVRWRAINNGRPYKFALACRHCNPQDAA